MATIQRFVNTASTPGGDGTTNNTAGATRAYASLSEWAANVASSATDDFIVDCCGTAADTATADVDFVTNITTGSVLIRGNRSDAAGFYNGTLTISSSHYRLSGTLNAESFMLRIAEANTTVDGIQVQASRSSASQAASFRLISMVALGEMTTRNCRVLGLNSGANIGCGIGSTSTLGSSSTWTIENNLVVSTIVGISRVVSQNFSPTINIQHNTVYGTNADSGIGISTNRGSSGGGSPVVNIKGNAIANNAASDITSSGTVGTVNSADNATEDSTGEVISLSPSTAWTSPGVGASSVFTVRSTGSALFAGVSPTLLSEDITEFTRDGSSHDIGAFEFQGPTDKFVQVKLVTSPTNSTARANLTGLKYAFFDVMPWTGSPLSAPVVVGTNGTTDASGFFTLQISNSVLLPGGVGYLIITDTSGAVTESPNARVFAGPVLVQSAGSPS